MDNTLTKENVGKYDKKQRMKKIGRFCKKYREDYLRLSLTDFGELTDLNIKSVSAFEHGNANSIDYLYHYYNLSKGLNKKVFISNVFEI